jgi:hypothetical protein
MDSLSPPPMVYLQYLGLTQTFFVPYRDSSGRFFGQVFSTSSELLIHDLKPFELQFHSDGWPVRGSDFLDWSR